MSITVELRHDPRMKAIVRAAFPRYAKRRAYVSVFSSHGERINSYWDGGSRDEYAIVELATLRPSTLPTATHPYFDLAARGVASTEDEYVTVDHVGNVRLKAIPPGFVLVQAGTFCGKPATAHCAFHPADLPQQLTEGSLA